MNAFDELSRLKESKRMTLWFTQDWITYVNYEEVIEVQYYSYPSTKYVHYLPLYINGRSVIVEKLSVTYCPSIGIGYNAFAGSGTIAIGNT